MLALEFPQFQLHQLRGYIQEIYLAVYPDKIFLLDGTSRSDVDLVARYITELGRPLEQLKLCAITHMHPDHAGGAAGYRKQFGTQIIASPYAAMWYGGARGRLQHLLDTAMGQFVARQSAGMNRRMWYPHRTPPNIEARHNKPVPGFEDWLTLETPGHTDHDISLYHPDTGLLYVADVVLRIRQKFVLPFPVTLPAVMEHTLRYLGTLPTTHLLMAHGGIAQPETPAELFAKLQELVWLKPGRQFRVMKYFVHITGSVKRAQQRLGATHRPT